MYAKARTCASFGELGAHLPFQHNQLTKPYMLPFGKLLVCVEIERLEKPSTIQPQFLEDRDGQQAVG
jgi:hypothetical protein